MAPVPALFRREKGTCWTFNIRLWTATFTASLIPVWIKFKKMTILIFPNLRWFLLKFKPRYVDCTYREGNCISAVWVYFQVWIRSVCRHNDSCLYHSFAVHCSLMLSPGGFNFQGSFVITRYYSPLFIFARATYLTLTPALIVLLNANVRDVDVYPFIIDSNHLNGVKCKKNKCLIL